MITNKEYLNGLEEICVIKSFVTCVRGTWHKEMKRKLMRTKIKYIESDKDRTSIKA